MAEVLLTAPIEGAPFHRAHSGSRRSTQPSHHHTISFVFYLFSTQSGKHPDKRAARWLLHCACRKRAYTVTPQREQPDCSSLRASRDHRFIVGPLRVRRMVWLFPSYFSAVARCASKKGNRLPAIFSSARPSTPSPPSLCAAHRPWLVLAPSRRQGAAAETLRQRPSCAPHLF